MLTLNDGRSELWQWDTGRTLAVDADCSQVHFSNKVFGRSIDVDVVDGVAIIPDILLQTDKELNVWAFVGTADNGYTKISKIFTVNRRNKPADYVFTQTDQMTLQTIQSQIGDLTDLTTEAKDTLVDAINEAARTGGGGGGSTVELDTTLTKSGQAADAAAVGNRLSSLSDEIVTTSESKVSAHNTGTDTHSDIRLLIQGLTDRLNALADSDDTTLDQLSEVVAYIKSNRGLIEAITTSKVSVTDIVNDLTTNVANKPLSAAQGVALKALIDAITIPEALPNPNALTFTGSVAGSYDGSSPLTVNIPSGGGGSSLPTPTEEDVGKVPVVQEDLSFGLGNMVGGDWEVISDLTLGEESASVSFDIDVTYRRLWFIVYGVPASGTNSKLKIEFTKFSDQTKCIIEVNNGIQAANTTDGANKRPAQIYLEKINGYVPFALSAVNNGGNTPNAAMLSIGTDSFKVDWSDIYKVSFTALNTSFSSGSIFKLWGYK